MKLKNEKKSSNSLIKKKQILLEVKKMLGISRVPHNIPKVPDTLTISQNLLVTFALNLHINLSERLIPLKYFFFWKRGRKVADFAEHPWKSAINYNKTTKQNKVMV